MKRRKNKRHGQNASRFLSASLCWSNNVFVEFLLYFSLSLFQLRDTKKLESTICCFLFSVLIQTKIFPLYVLMSNDFLTACDSDFRFLLRNSRIESFIQIYRQIRLQLIRTFRLRVQFVAGYSWCREKHILLINEFCLDKNRAIFRTSIKSLFLVGFFYHLFIWFFGSALRDNDEIERTNKKSCIRCRPIASHLFTAV